MGTMVHWAPRPNHSDSLDLSRGHAPAPFSSSLGSPAEVWASRSQTLNNLFLKCYGFNWRSESSHSVYLSFQTMMLMVLGFVSSMLRNVQAIGRSCLRFVGVTARDEVGFPPLQPQDYTTNTLLVIYPCLPLPSCFSIAMKQFQCTESIITSFFFYIFSP